MFCQNCGKEVQEHAVVCLSCGAAVKPQGQQLNVTDGSIGCLLGGVCFLFPMVGLILYLVWKDQMPQKAKEAGKWALIGFVISIVFSVIYVIGVGLAAAAY